MIRRSEDTEQAMASYDIEMFHDGDCPLCAKEVAWLRRLDRRNRIRFTDISDPGFDPAKYGKTMDDFMARMHGRRADGVWVTGVETFRQLYASVGFRWLVAPTRLPGISWALDCGYSFFARYRLRLTGRCSNGSCSIPERKTEHTDSGAAS
jgi:predicted DCC family thiol-disulfide oxidoreductase YuxK